MNFRCPKYIYRGNVNKRWTEHVLQLGVWWWPINRGKRWIGSDVKHITETTMDKHYVGTRFNYIHQPIFFVCIYYIYCWLRRDKHTEVVACNAKDVGCYCWLLYLVLASLFYVDVLTHEGNNIYERSWWHISNIVLIASRI